MDVLRVLLANHVRPDRQGFELAQIIEWHEGATLLADFSYDDVPEKKKHNSHFVQREERSAQADDRNFVSIQFYD
ncbi:uncharacterized protein BDV14DRAFT_97793 [Aspergillus stella-maris]|uniref:uncharacterized protein n=1 Tax=Aspergillus stella-maris TaxID=1810926 RepID=UPI003CCDA6E4